MPEGITPRHKRHCASRNGAACNCEVSYQAQVFDRISGKRKSRSFPTLAAARGWRHDAAGALRRGELVLGRVDTVAEAWAEWEKAAKDGLILNRGGERFKPSTLRGYSTSMRERILPLIGGAKLQNIERPDLQRLVYRLQEDDLDASTVRNAIIPLRSLFRKAVSVGTVGTNPTQGLMLPAVRGRRDRIVSPDEAADLLEQLPVDQRALWATALYAGLRHGELRALRWENVDLAGGLIHVVESWDHVEGVIEPKSAAGRRRVPLATILRDPLLEHQLDQGRRAGLAFGRDADRPFVSTTVNDRADAAWGRKREDGEWAEPPPLRLHEARHTYASFMIAAGVNVKELATYMGHSSITITLDRYGHLFPGAGDEAMKLLQAYLERANTKGRLAAIASPDGEGPE